LNLSTVLRLVPQPLEEHTEDISSKRGQIEGTTEVGGKTIVNSKIPLSEMFGYTNTLRSMTQARASMTMEFDHYEVAPPNVAEDIKKARGVS
jgi:elongation factor G